MSNGFAISFKTNKYDNNFPSTGTWKSDDNFWTHSQASYIAGIQRKRSKQHPGQLQLSKAKPNRAKPTNGTPRSRIYHSFREFSNWSVVEFSKPHPHPHPPTSSPYTTNNYYQQTTLTPLKHSCRAPTSIAQKSAMQWRKNHTFFSRLDWMVQWLSM